MVYNKLYNKKVIVFDGVCALCNNFVIFVIKNDKKISTNLFPYKIYNKINCAISINYLMKKLILFY